MNTRDKSMNDRLKFRGMNKGKWYYGGYFKHLPYTPQPIRDSEVPEKDYKHLIIQDGFSDWGLPRNMICIEIEPETIGQCTGLRDKNGKLIYEGDIIRQPDGCIGVIVWQGVSYWVESPGSHARDLEHSPYYESVEVIGNVYENPELLEAKNE